MSEIEETSLPGVGFRHDFLCRNGRRVGVVSHHTGRRDVLIYDEHDPDAVKAAIELSSEESRTLAEMLGGTTVTEHLGQIHQQVEGLAIDWLPLPNSFEPQTIGAGEYRQRTGVSIVAVIRGGDTIPAPGPDEVLSPGDVVVVVGTSESIERLTEMLGG
ncbi:MAG: cation:proton antiporter regulatory subunit [Acidimicrobiales bacterium]|nr:cation:proton antiporter regulatory subunit [Acidimicrobiales bacterium]